MDTDLTKRQLRSRMLVVPTPRTLSPRQMTTLDNTDSHSYTPQVEQDPSSPRFHSSENESCHEDIKGHMDRITESNKTNKKPSPLLNPSKLININWKLKRTNSKG